MRLQSLSTSPHPSPSYKQGITAVNGVVDLPGLFLSRTFISLLNVI